jgi:hypothetical protein
VAVAGAQDGAQAAVAADRSFIALGAGVAAGDPAESEQDPEPLDQASGVAAELLAGDGVAAMRAGLGVLAASTRSTHVRAAGTTPTSAPRL